MQFLNKERDLIPHSFASGKASVTILSQPEMCTVTPSNPHNMLGVVRFASVTVHSPSTELRPVQRRAPSEEKDLALSKGYA